MKNASVLIPFTGSIFVYLEDLPDETTEDDCFNLALDAMPDRENWHSQVNELEYHRQMNRGNVCYAQNTEMTVDFEDLNEEVIEDDSDHPFDSERHPDTLRENEDFAQDNISVNECDDLCLGIMLSRGI